MYPYDEEPNNFNDGLHTTLLRGYGEHSQFGGSSGTERLSSAVMNDQTSGMGAVRHYGTYEDHSGFGSNSESDRLNSALMNDKTSGMGVELHFDTLEKNLSSLDEAIQKNGRLLSMHGEEVHSVDMLGAARDTMQYADSLGHADQATDDLIQKTRALGAETSKLDNKTAESDKAAEKLAQKQAKLAENVLKAASKPMGDIVNAHWTSIAGAEQGNRMGSATSGMLQGASMGASFGPWGAAAGAAIGLVTGLIEGEAKNFQARDDAFKAVYKGAYDDWVNYRQQTLASGSVTAASRETDLLNLQLAFGLDSEFDVEGLHDWIRGQSGRYNLDYNDQMAMGTVLAGYEGVEMLTMTSVMGNIGVMGVAQDLGTGDMVAMADALGQLTQMSDLTEAALGDLRKQVPGLDMLMTSLEEADFDLSSLFAQGALSGNDAAQEISVAIGQMNGAIYDMKSGTFEALSSSVANMEAELNSAMGEGYNEKKKEGLERELQMMEGETGERMQEAFRLMGEYEAGLENQQREAYWSTIQAAMESDDYLDALADDDGARMGEILALARTEAENAFMQGEGYQNKLASEQKIIDSLREELADGWENFGYTMGLEFTKGLKSTAAYRKAALSDWDGEANAEWSVFTSEGPNPNMTGFAEAMGLAYVPYDDFPARLHEGERVLTASEARAYNARDLDGTDTAFVGVGGRSVGDVRVEVAGNTFVVREEADVDRIAEAIAQRFTRTLRVS